MIEELTDSEYDDIYGYLGAQNMKFSVCTQHPCTFDIRYLRRGTWQSTYAVRKSDLLDFIDQVVISPDEYEMELPYPDSHTKDRPQGRDEYLLTWWAVQLYYDHQDRFGNTYDTSDDDISELFMFRPYSNVDRTIKRIFKEYKDNYFLFLDTIKESMTVNREFLKKLLLNRTDIISFMKRCYNKHTLFTEHTHAEFSREFYILNIYERDKPDDPIENYMSLGFYETLPSLPLPRARILSQDGETPQDYPDWLKPMESNSKDTFERFLRYVEIDDSAVYHLDNGVEYTMTEEDDENGDAYIAMDFFFDIDNPTLKAPSGYDLYDSIEKFEQEWGIHHVEIPPTGITSDKVVVHFYRDYKPGDFFFVNNVTSRKQAEELLEQVINTIFDKSVLYVYEMLVPKPPKQQCPQDYPDWLSKRNNDATGRGKVLLDKLGFKIYDTMSPDFESSLDYDIGWVDDNSINITYWVYVENPLYAYVSQYHDFESPADLPKDLRRVAVDCVMNYWNERFNNVDCDTSHLASPGFEMETLNTFLYGSIDVPDNDVIENSSALELRAWFEEELQKVWDNCKGDDFVEIMADEQFYLPPIAKCIEENRHIEKPMDYPDWLSKVSVTMEFGEVAKDWSSKEDEIKGRIKKFIIDHNYGNGDLFENFMGRYGLYTFATNNRDFVKNFGSLQMQEIWKYLNGVDSDDFWIEYMIWVLGVVPKEHSHVADMLNVSEPTFGPITFGEIPEKFLSKSESPQDYPDWLSKKSVDDDDDDDEPTPFDSNEWNEVELIFSDIDPENYDAVPFGRATVMTLLKEPEKEELKNIKFIVRQKEAAEAAKQFLLRYILMKDFDEYEHLRVAKILLTNLLSMGHITRDEFLDLIDINDGRDIFSPGGLIKTGSMEYYDLKPEAADYISLYYNPFDVLGVIGTTNWREERGICHLTESVATFVMMDRDEAKLYGADDIRDFKMRKGSILTTDDFNELEKSIGQIKDYNIGVVGNVFEYSILSNHGKTYTVICRCDLKEWLEETIYELASLDYATSSEYVNDRLSNFKKWLEYIFPSMTDSEFKNIILKINKKGGELGWFGHGSSAFDEFINTIRGSELKPQDIFERFDVDYAGAVTVLMKYYDDIDLARMTYPTMVGSSNGVKTTQNFIVLYDVSAEEMSIVPKLALGMEDIAVNKETVHGGAMYPTWLSGGAFEKTINTLNM